MARVTRAWGGALLLTIALLALGWPRAWLHQTAREGIFSFENGAAWFQVRLWRPVARLWRASAVERRNALLEAEVERLRLDAALLETIAQENAALRRPFDLPDRPPGRLLPAWVLSAGGTTGWWRQIRINRGRADGVAPGDPVLAADGLVGRVVSLDQSSADVLLLTDANSRLACQLDPVSPEVGVVRGILQGSGRRAGREGLPTLLHVIEPLRLRYLERDVVPPPRIRVVTSGLGGGVPAGLLVGYLLRSDVDENGLYRIGEVMPAADLSALAHVYVLTHAGAAP